MRKLSVLIVAGMVAVSASFCAAAAEKNIPQGVSGERPKASAVGADTTEASAIQALGVVKGKPIDSGIVFIDGRYVEAPYTVSRRGRQIFINDILVYQWAEWPLMDRHVREDPGPPPKEYEKLTSFAEIIDSKEWLNSHLYRKRRYLYEHFSKKEADEKMMEYYRQCPFVASARFVPEWGHVEIITKSGMKENVLLTAPPPHTVGHWDFSVQDVIRGLESWLNSYTRSLSENDTLFFFGVPFQEYVPELRPTGFYSSPWKRPGDLQLMVEILMSARDEAEKIELLGRMDFLPSPNAVKFLHPVFAAKAAKTKEYYEMLIRNFRPSEQLDKRIEEMVKKSGVAPRTLKDLPDEIPWDKMMRLAKEKREREQREKEGQKKEQGAGEKN
jgi:hypothetical protein